MTVLSRLPHRHHDLPDYRTAVTITGLPDIEARGLRTCPSPVEGVEGGGNNFAGGRRRVDCIRGSADEGIIQGVHVTVADGGMIKGIIGTSAVGVSAHGFLGGMHVVADAVGPPFGGIVEGKDIGTRFIASR